MTAGKTALRFGVDTFDGVGNFTSLTIDKVCTACRLRFVYKSLQVYSDVFDVIPSPPYAVEAVTFPTNGISAVDLFPGPAVRVLDKGGNLISTPFKALIYKESGFGRLRQRQTPGEAGITVQSSGGEDNTATFTQIFFDSPSKGPSTTDYVVGFNATFPEGQVVNAVISGLVVTDKVAYGQFKTGFLQLPNQTASLPFTVQPQITLLDGRDTQVKTEEAQIEVTAALLNAHGASLQGTTVVTSIGGVATYTDLAVDKSGEGYVVKFSFISCNDGLGCAALSYVCASLSEFCANAYTTSALESSPFGIKVGFGSDLNIQVQSSDVTAGVAMNPAPIIRILDLGGNRVYAATLVAVSLIAGDTGAALLTSAEDMLVNAVDGIATFPAISVDKTGSGLRLRFISTNADGQPLEVFSDTFSVTAAPINSIAVAVEPGSALRGSLLSVQPIVTVRDVFDNVAVEDAFVTTVTAELIGFGQVGTLGGRVVQSFVGGQATFTDLSVNNPAARYVIRFSANGTYDASFPKVGTGRAVINPPLLAESHSFIVTGLVTGLELQQQPASAFGGSAFGQQPRVALIDLNRQIVASSSRTVRVSVLAGPSDDPILRPIPALQAARFGVVQFTDLSIDHAGQGYRLQFEVLGLSEPVTITSDAFEVEVGQPHALKLVTQPTDTTAAVPIEPAPAVVVVDIGGNTVPYNGTIMLEAVHGPLIERYDIATDSGTAVFTHVVNPAGADFRLRFSLLQNGNTIQVTSNPFAVALGVAAILDIFVQPGHAIVNELLTVTPVVMVKDAGGNLLIDYPHAVSVSRQSGPSASYPAGNISITPVGGVARFRDISVTGTARSYTLRFETTEPTLSGPRTISAVSHPFTVTWPPVKLRVQNPPGPRDNAQIGGEAFTFHPAVAFEDSENQVVKAKSSPISLSLPATSGLAGTSVVPAFEGISIFTDLSIDLASMPAFHSIIVTGEVLSATLAVQVKPGMASSLSIMRQPGDAMSATVFFAPVILRFLDLGGNVVTGPSAAEPVTVALEANKFGGQLQGTLTVSPISGVATFNDLMVTGIGSGYSLLFTSASYRVESNSFGVQGEPTSLGMISCPPGVIVYTGGVVDEYPFFPSVRVALLDDAKNVITGGAWRAPFAQVSVVLDKEFAWDVENDRYPPADVQFDSSKGSTTAIIQNGYALFDKLLLVTNAASTKLQGLRLRFASNVTVDQLYSPYFSTSRGEAFLTPKRQPAPIQSSGLTLMPMPTVNIRTESRSGAIVRGSVLPLTVSLKDANGVTLEGTTTLNVSAGTYTFTDLSIQTASEAGQSYTLQFSVPASNRNPQLFPDLTIISDPFTVSVGPPASISLHTPIAPSTSGVPFFSQPCVALRDAGSNLVRSVRTVSASLIAQAPDHAQQMGQNSANSTDGLASFTDLGITNLTHGAFYQIAFQSGDLEVRSTVFTGLSGPPVNIEILNSPQTSKGGLPLTPAPHLRVTDAGGTPVTGPVQIAASLESNPNGMGALLNNIALITNGEAFFTQLSVDRAGAGYMIRFQSASAVAIPQAFDVVVGPARRLFVDEQPGASVFGVNIVPTPRVAVLDEGYNWVTSSAAEVHARLVVPQSANVRLRARTKLRGSLARTASAGLSVFDDLTIDNAGSGFRIEFSSIGLDVFVTERFDVTGPPAVMAVEFDPLWVTAGAVASRDSPFQYQPVVRIKDFDHIAVDYYNVIHGVTASVGDGQELAGNPVADVIRGAAIFTDLQLLKSSDAARLSFHYGGPMLTTSALSTAITVKAGKPRLLDILQQPSSASRGMKLGLQPRIQILDTFHNIVTWYSGTLTARLRFGDANKQEHFRGTTTAPFADSTGIATFTDLSVVLEEQSLYMRFQSGGIRIDSQHFNIKEGPPNLMVLGNPPVGGVSTVGNGILQPQPIINVVDQGYGIVSSFSGANRCAGRACDVSVKLICCPINFLGEYAGAGVLSGRTEVTAVAGQAFFTDLAIDAPGDYTLQFRVNQIEGISGEIIYDLSRIPVQDFTSMVILGEPGQALLGLAMRGQPRIQITDSLNQKVNASYHQVDVRLVEGVGCVGLQGTTTAVAVQGLVQFTDLVLSTFVGTPTCRFNFSTTSPPMYALSEFFAMTYGPSELLLPEQPDGAQAGLVLTSQPRLEFRDKGNFLLESESGQVISAELVQGNYDALCGAVSCQGLLKGTTSILNVNGIATFTDLRVDRVHAPGYIILFRMGKYTIYSQKFTVALGTANSLQVLTQPFTCQVTIPMPASPSLEILDAGLNRVNSSAAASARIHPTSFTGIRVTGGETSATEGKVTFGNITLYGDAALGIALEFMCSGLSVVSDMFLAHRPPRSLVLQNPMPSTLVAGEDFLPEQQIGLRDDFDFPALADSSSRINVSLVHKDTGAVTEMPDSEVASSGLAIFRELKVRAKGQSYFFRYFLASTPSVYAESNYFTVVANRPKHILVLQQPRLTAAADIMLPFPSVSTEDEFNNRVTFSAGDYVTVCVNQGGQCSAAASIQGQTSQALETETVTFANIALHGPPAAGYRLLFYLGQASPPTISAVSNAFDVMTGKAQLGIVQQPKYAKQGQPFFTQPVVVISDGAGNRFAGPAGGINYLPITASISRRSVDDATLSDAVGDCPCTARIIDGVATFSGLKINRAGRAFQIEFSLPLLNVKTVVSGEMHVSGAVLYMNVAGLHASIAYQTPFDVSVELRDANGLSVADKALAVAVLDDTGAVHDLMQGVTTVVAMDGVGTFSALSFRHSGGPFRLQFNASGVIDHSDEFMVTARAGTNIALQGLPQRFLAMTQIHPAPDIQVFDEFGSVSAFAGNVIVSVMDSTNASVQPPLTVSATGGIASLSEMRVLRVSSGQGFRLQIQALFLGQMQVVYSDMFHVDAGRLAALMCYVQPSDGVTGQPLRRQPTVRAVDAGNNLLDYFSKQITLALNDTDTATALKGTSIILALNGVATFTDLVVDKPKDRHEFLISTSESCGIVSRSDPFKISLPDTYMSLTVVPPIPNGGSLWTPQPEVTFFDERGVSVSAIEETVTMTICVKPVDSLATLHGTTTLAAVDGVVRFTDVSIDRRGEYTICYTSSNYVVNQTLEVRLGDARYIEMVREPSVVNAAQNLRDLMLIGTNPIFRVRDAGGNPFLSASGQGLRVEHLRIEVIDDGTRSKPQMLMCRTCPPGVVYPCYYAAPFDGVGVFFSEQTPECFIKNPGRNIKLKFSIIDSGIAIASVLSAPFDVVTGGCDSLKVILHPRGVIAGQAFRRPPIVEMRDQGGNPITWVRNVIKVSLAADVSADATLSGCRDVITGDTPNTNVDGTATFFGCQIDCNPVESFNCHGQDLFRLQFQMLSCDGKDLSSITYFTNYFTVSREADELQIKDGTLPTTMSAGLFMTQPQVEFWRAPCNNNVNSKCFVETTPSDTMVSAEIYGAPNGATLRGTTSVRVVNGVAQFTDLSVREASALLTPSTYNVTFHATGFKKIWQTMTVEVGTANALVVTQQPTLASPGNSFSAQVSVVDAGGNVVTAAAEKLYITMALDASFGVKTGVTLKTSAASLSVQTSSGVAAWSGLTVNKAPVIYSFTFSATKADGTQLEVKSSKISLVIGEVAEIQLLSHPRDVHSGSNLPTLVAQLYDAGGNKIRTDLALIVNIELSAGDGTLTGIPNTTISSEGVATFAGLGVTYASGESMHVLKIMHGAISVKSNPFYVHLPPSKIVLRARPAQWGFAGKVLPEQPVLELRDAQENRAYAATNGSLGLFVVSATLVGAGGSLQGNLQALAVKGVASFTDLLISAAGSYTISFSSAAFTPVVSPSLEIRAGLVAALQVVPTYQPGMNGTNEAGFSLPLQPRVQLVDSGGGIPNPVPAEHVIARIFSYPAGTSTSAITVLYGSHAAPDAVTGIAHFTDLAINAVGEFSLEFSLGALRVSSIPFMIVPGPIAQIVYTTQPSPAVFDEVLFQQPVVQLLDKGSNPVRGTPWIHVTLGKGRTSGSTLQGCEAAYAVQDTGVVSMADCKVSGTASGEHTLLVHTLLSGKDVLAADFVFDPLMDSKLAHESAPFTVSLPIHKLVIDNEAAGAISTVPWTAQPTIHAVDSQDTLIQLRGAYIAVSIGFKNETWLHGSRLAPLQAGIAKFTDLRINISGVYSLNFSLSVAGVDYFTQQSLTVSAGAPSKLLAHGWPSVVISGQNVASTATSPRIIVQDSVSNPITDSINVSVTADCIGGGSPCLAGVLTGAVSFGEARFDEVYLRRPGNVTLTFTHASLSIAISVEVAAGAAASIIIPQPPPRSFLVGTTITPSMQILLQDEYGNTAPDPNHPNATVAMHSSPILSALLEGDAACTIVEGVGVFNGPLSISASGFGFRLIFTSGSLRTVSLPFNVHSLAEQMKFESFPNQARGGSFLDPQPRIVLVDDAGAPVLDPPFTVTARVEARTAAMTGQASAVTVNGRASFTDLKLDKMGKHTLHFECNNGIKIISLVSPALILTPGEPHSISVEEQPGGFATGGMTMPIQPQVFLRDAGGNLADMAREVVVSIQAPTTARIGGTVRQMSGGNYGMPLTTYSNGALAFTDLGIDAAGSHILLFTSPGLISAQSAAFDVAVGPAHKLTIIRQPADVNVGVPFGIQPVIQIQDHGGNHVEELEFDVTASINMHSVRKEILGSLELQGALGVPSILGWSNFTALQIDVAGLFCDLRFSSPGLVSAISDTFIIAAVSPAASCLSDINFLSDCGSSVTKSKILRVEIGPSDVINGFPFDTAPEIRIRDKDGVILKMEGSVYASLVSAPDGVRLLNGRQDFVDGVAVFPGMSIDTVGHNVRIQFRFQDLVAISAAFNVTAGAATKTRIATPVASEWIVNRAFSTFTIEIVDHGGFLVSEPGSYSACPNISVAIQSGPNIQLSGPTTVPVVAGKAHFVGLTISISALYSLRFACQGADTSTIAPVDTDQIILHSYAQPLSLEIVSEPGPAVASFDGSTSRKEFRFTEHPIIRLVDAFGNLVHGFQGHFKADKKFGGFTDATLGGGDSVILPATWGMVEFDDLIFTTNDALMQNETVQLQFGSTCCSLMSASEAVNSKVIVLNAAPTVLDVTTPGTVQAGEPFAMNITMKISAALEVYTYLGAVAITLHRQSDNTISSAIAGQLLQAGRRGMVSFPGLVISTPDTYYIRAYASRPGLHLDMLQADSSAFTVVGGPARALSFLNHSSGCKGGTLCAVQPQFQLTDASGNPAAVSGVPVTATIQATQSSAGAACCIESQQDCPVHDTVCPLLGGAKTATSDASGRIAFSDISVSTAGSVILRYSALDVSIEEVVHVNVGDPARAKIVLPQAGLVAGIAFSRQPVVIAADYGGNWISTAADNVTSRVTLLGCTTGTLGCESFGTPFAANGGGISRFTDLGTKYAGPIRLEFRLRSVPTCGAVSCWSTTQVMQVAPGIPAQIVIISSTVEHFCSGTLTPAWDLEIRDASGNRVISGGPYAVSVSSTPPNQIAGETSVLSKVGRASFNNTNIMKSCYFFSSDPFDKCYTVTFRLNDIAVTSNPFTVLAGPAIDMVFHTEPAETAVGSPPGYPSVRLVDVVGNPVFPVPATVPISCGVLDALSGPQHNDGTFNGVNLRADLVSPAISYEQTDGLALLLGADRSYVAKTSLVFNGLNLNWRVPQCYFPSSCPNTVDDFRNFRIRAVARFGSLVADSPPLAIDVAHPVDFKVYYTNFSAIVLSWNAPFFGPAASSYRLRYRSTSTPGAEWITLTGITTNMYTFGNLDRYALMEFEICSQSLFGERCALRGPAPRLAAPVQAVEFAEIAYANEASVFVSWRVPPHGLPPPAYRITIQEMPNGWETVLLNDVVGLNVSIPELSPNKTYVFGVYSKAAGGDYYSNTGAKTDSIMPTAATSSAGLFCPLDAFGEEECTGTGLILKWSKPTIGLYQPRGYKVVVEQRFPNTSLAFFSEQVVEKSDAQMSVTVLGLTRGRSAKVQLLSQAYNSDIYAPSVAFYVVLTAAPSAPVDLVLKMRDNKVILASWGIPLDSGDGTQHGTRLNSYVISYSITGANGWTKVANMGKNNVTREFTGLALDESHTFRISAENDFLFGQRCTFECSDLEPLLLVGRHIEASFVLGQIPFWDSMHAPVKQDPPVLYNLFAGSLFTFSLKALSTGPAEQITITARGLEDCGAALTSVVKGNPATATLTLLPAIQHLDKTFWICFTAMDGRGAFSDERCLRAYVVRPNPTFLAPIDPSMTDAVVRSSFTVASGCLLEFDVKAHDLTSGASISATTASSFGYNCFLKEHRTIIFSKYESRTIEGLPEHAVLEQGLVQYANPSTRTFSWRPARGQEAFNYNVCFTVEDQLGTSNTASPAFDGSFCVHIGVLRCRACLLPGDSLFSVAQKYKTEWLNLWASNSALLRPAEAAATSEIVLGPLYKAMHFDSVNSIASRMSLDPSLLLSWNPDLQSAFRGGKTDVVLEVEQEICILPSTCTQ